MGGAIVPPDAPSPTPLQAAAPLPPEALANIADPELRAKVEAHNAAHAAAEPAKEKSAVWCEGGGKKIVLTMDDAMAKKKLCEHCGKTIALKPVKEGEAWIADLPKHKPVAATAPIEVAPPPPPQPETDEEKAIFYKVRATGIGAIYTKEGVSSPDGWILRKPRNTVEKEIAEGKRPGYEHAPLPPSATAAVVVPPAYTPLPPSATAAVVAPLASPAPATDQGPTGVDYATLTEIKPTWSERERRDRFAAAALQGVLAREGGDPAYLARQVVIFVDALIVALG
jgi:hypothetical protein